MNGLETILVSLGDQEPRVAQTLDWAGVEGRRKSPSHCPVANWLSLYFPDAFDIRVTSIQVEVWDDRDGFPAVRYEVPTPEGVGAFVDSFDQGRYPGLDSARASYIGS